MTICGSYVKNLNIISQIMLYFSFHDKPHTATDFTALIGKIKFHIVLIAKIAVVEEEKNY